MRRTQIQLTEQQLRRLSRAAGEHGVSLAEMVRQCVDRTLAERGDLAAGYARASRLVGAFHDREQAHDVARHHDRYLDPAVE